MADAPAATKLIAPKPITEASAADGPLACHEGMTLVAQLVTNPLYAALQNALRTVEPLIGDIERRVEGPYLHFHNGTVWTGPAARRFDQQFAHHRSRVRTAGDRILSDLRQALAGTPAEVTEEEARTIRTRYGLP